MAKKSVSPVPAKALRAAFMTGAFTATEAALPSLIGNPGKSVRGRIHPDAVAAAAAEAGLVYIEKVAEAKTISLPVTKVSKTGATLQRPVDVPLSEFRRLSGTKAGRPSKASLAVAAAKWASEHA